MNKAELIAAMSNETGITKTDTEKQLNAFIKVVSEELAKNGKVQLVGFGTFETVDRAERKCKNTFAILKYRRVFYNRNVIGIKFYLTLINVLVLDVFT